MNLIEQLKEAGEDYEYYPTTREMVRCIYDHRRSKWRDDDTRYHVKPFGDLLDIGCGSCHFKRFIDEFNEAEAIPRNGYVDRDNCVGLGQYYVMEKSKILIDRLPADAIVLGMDFDANTLIDKQVETVFCNPPYKHFEDWAARIITESVCHDIYLIIPQRWQQSEKIQAAISKLERRYLRWAQQEAQVVEVIGSFDFLDAERSARAKVDIVHIDKSHTREDSGFNHYFEEVFGKPTRSDEQNFESEEYRQKLKHELITGRNKIEILCAGYEETQRVLFRHFKAICELDADILENLGIRQENVKSALRKKIKGLKALYWQLAFDCLDAITTRLTSTSRAKMMGDFDKLLTVDFSADNVYALVIWVIKHANAYYKSQMVDLFKGLSNPESVRNYKSNERVFQRNRWGYLDREHDRYTLDYRIICDKHYLPSARDYYGLHPTVQDLLRVKIADILTVAHNLGFLVGNILYPDGYGQKGYAYMADDTVLCEFKLYQNGNVHIKFNKDFIRAMNVEVSRELGWIQTKEDIAREFPDEMAEGAEQYFERTHQFSMTSFPALMNTES